MKKILLINAFVAICSFFTIAQNTTITPTIKSMKLRMQLYNGTIIGYCAQSRIFNESKSTFLNYKTKYKESTVLFKKWLLDNKLNTNKQQAVVCYPVFVTNEMLKENARDYIFYVPREKIQREVFNGVEIKYLDGDSIYNGFISKCYIPYDFDGSFLTSFLSFFESCSENSFEDKDKTYIVYDEKGKLFINYVDKETFMRLQNKYSAMR